MVATAAKLNPEYKANDSVEDMIYGSTRLVNKSPMGVLRFLASDDILGFIKKLQMILEV
jgi:hypothetical protein